MKFTIAFLPCLVAVTPAGFAHPGGLNAQGCHNNRKTGDYHCHRAGAESPLPLRAPSSREGSGSTYLPTVLRRERQALHRCDAAIPDIGPDLIATMMTWPANDMMRPGSSDEATWPFRQCALAQTLGTVRINPISDERAMSELEAPLEQNLHPRTLAGGRLPTWPTIQTHRCHTGSDPRMISGLALFWPIRVSGWSSMQRLFVFLESGRQRGWRQRNDAVVKPANSGPWPRPVWRRLRRA